MESAGIRQRKLKSEDSKDSKDSKEYETLPTTKPVDRSHSSFLTLLKIIAILVVSPILFLLAIDFLVSHPIDPEMFSLSSPPKLEGPLAPNKLLAAAERLYEGHLKGPESILVRDGHLYTGTADGKILHVHNGIIQIVTRLGKPPCGRFADEPTCGRPLGMRFDVDGNIIVADAYLGLFKVNIETGTSEMLFNASTKIAGKEPRFLNDLDIAYDGTIYVSDSSTSWDRRHHPLAIIENRGDGRLLKFNPSTGTMTVLKQGLYFANGVQLSHREDYILISETSRCRITKYHLKGILAGTSEIFADNLPGLPDNVRRSSSGGYWVAMASHRSAGFFSMFDFLGQWPSIRRITPKLLHMNTITKLAAKPYGLIVEFDTEGNIVRSLHDPESVKIGFASEVHDEAGELYIGSFKAPFIGKLSSKN